VLADENLWQKSEEMQRFFSAVNALGVADYVRYAPHIIRGLEYYTGTVFECWDVDGEFRAILGGGRYDDLVRDVGGQPLSGVGFAMGDLVVSLVLQKFNCLPQDLGVSPAEVLVTVFDEKGMANALHLAAELRQSGLRTAVYPEPAKLGKQFKYADRMGMRVAAILGPDELAAGQVAIKDLRQGAQHSVARQAAAGSIRQLLDSHLSS
jgi:histidyl-tRNA synthetase